MIDIVERLREADEYKEVFDHMNRPYGLAKSIDHEAADEIEKLRAALDKAADALHDAGCYDAWAEARAALGETK